MSHDPEIKFGTDGWRAVIGDTYTFANVERVAAATASWLKKSGPPELEVVIGYDTRFLGQEFAERAAQVLGSRGVRVILSDTFTTTPAVSWATKTFGASAGVVITASHNPPSYSGYKLKASFGGPSTPEDVAAVESEIVAERPEDLIPLNDLMADGTVRVIDYTSPYLDAVSSILDIEGIRSSGIRIAYDAMFGSGQGSLTRLLSAEQVLTLRHGNNPGFLGQAPEPIERNLETLSTFVRENGCDIGMATDGDADRIGLFDEKGQFVDAHRIMALLFKYLSQEKGIAGDVVKSFAATDLLDKMGRAYGVNVETTKIGFKYIASRMVDGNVVVGGEESGGIAAAGHIPERDGIYAGLLVIDMMVKSGKPLSVMVDELMAEFGQHWAFRRDLHISQEAKESFMQRLEQEGLSEVAGLQIDRVDDLDGFKFRTAAGPWVMIRPSGTEPVLRVYSEAESLEQAESLVDGIAAMVGR
jgi:phosphomannomutase